MKGTLGINYHPTSLEFTAKNNRDYRAELPPHLAESGLPKAVTCTVSFRLKSRNGNELTFLGNAGYLTEYHCKALKSPTTGAKVSYVTFRGVRLLLEAQVYIRGGKPITDFTLDNGRVADGRTLRQYLADEAAKVAKLKNNINN